MGTLFHMRMMQGVDFDETLPVIKEQFLLVGST